MFVEFPRRLEAQHHPLGLWQRSSRPAGIPHRAGRRGSFRRSAGRHLLEALRERMPRPRGVWHRRAAGCSPRACESWYPMEWFAVRGYVEVLRSLPKLLRVRRELKRRLLADPPDLFIGIDAPDFNLGPRSGLASRAASPRCTMSVPRSGHGAASASTRSSARYPRSWRCFRSKPPIYEKAGVPVAYVGHPLADELPEYPDRDAAREQMRMPPKQTVVALLPGSRQSEVRANGRAVRRHGQAGRRADSQCTFPGAAGQPRDPV